mmetsp:Transcript_16422/g.40584  ORF Transcript_16422/g.40584 Transcript_16422/m.40584 type:complete len:254 (-) Transcript_16422:450-1211(-)
MSTWWSPDRARREVWRVPTSRPLSRRRGLRPAEASKAGVRYCTTIRAVVLLPPLPRRRKGLLSRKAKASRARSATLYSRGLNRTPSQPHKPEDRFLQHRREKSLLLISARNRPFAATCQLSCRKQGCRHRFKSRSRIAQLLHLLQPLRQKPRWGSWCESSYNCTDVLALQAALYLLRRSSPCACGRTRRERRFGCVTMKSWRTCFGIGKPSPSQGPTGPDSTCRQCRRRSCACGRGRGGRRPLLMEVQVDVHR